MANRGKAHDREIFSMNDLERVGSQRLPRVYKEYYNEGAMDMITLRDNTSAYDRYLIRPRVVRNIENLDPSTTLFGSKISFPFAISPTAMQQMAHTEGEVGTSRAAAAAGIPMALSNYSTMPLEDVIAQSSGNPYMMQISMLKNKAATIRLIKRAEAAGFKALLLTLDCPWLGRRLNEFKNSFGVPEGMSYPNLFPGVDVSNLEDSGEEMGYDCAMEWEELVSFFRKHSKLQLWGKGIYHPEDIELAIRHGLDGIIISNHGGRQLDGVPATIDVLQECAPRFKGRISIAIDGGVRRGTDIFKAIAMGADLVLAGRPAIWGLAHNGHKGVELGIKILYDEFVTCMALAGCRNVEDIRKTDISILRNGVLAKL